MTYSTEEFQNDCEKLVLPTLAYALQKCLHKPELEASVVSSTKPPPPPRRLYVTYTTYRGVSKRGILVQRMKAVE